MNLTKDFFLGGNATFTVQSGKTGRHMTFRVRQPKPEMPHFVSVMTGTDNESHFSYMGVLNRENAVVKPTAKSKVLPGSEQWTVAEWALRQVWNNRQLSEGTKIQHAGKCGCCGRKLTNPESLSTGIGPECIKKFRK
jgi:hypothetical protein